MLVALYCSNEGAFVGKNMNRLDFSQILSIPYADSARSISNAEGPQCGAGTIQEFQGLQQYLG